MCNLSTEGDFLNRVKVLREEKKMLQSQLAEMLQVTQATLSNWERGVHNPDAETLTKMSQIFGCSVDYLLKISNIKYPLDDEGQQADQIFYRIAQDARTSGINPHDLQLAVDFLKKAKERDAYTE